MKKRKGFSLTTTHVIMLSFVALILIGTLLLLLPISTKERVSISFVDALFTATTSACVTGLTVVTTATTWSVFGQIVILFLIQIGGLGVITVMSAIAISFNRRMRLGDTILVMDAFNLNTMSELGRFVKKVVKGTLAVEGVGALLYMIAFVPKFGVRGIWISIFNSISAFCNAGIDIIGENSLASYVHDPIVNIVTCLLVILGGLGYIVWWDVIRVIKSKNRGFKYLTLHSKIVLSATAVMIVLGAVLIFIFEFDNPRSIGDYSLWQKVLASVFQSVTTRTAGFYTVPQSSLCTPSAVLSLLLMFIGGSPVGTAGGIKTVTLVVLIAYTSSIIRNKNSVSIFGRSLSKQALGKATAVCCMSFAIMFVSTILLSSGSDADMLDILYETGSATATVGLTRDLTSTLDMWGKLIIIATMYLGRIGPISLAVAFSLKKQAQNKIKDPTEEISVG